MYIHSFWERETTACFLHVEYLSHGELRIFNLKLFIFYLCSGKVTVQTTELGCPKDKLASFLCNES